MEELTDMYYTSVNSSELKKIKNKVFIFNQILSIEAIKKSVRVLLKNMTQGQVRCTKFCFCFPWRTLLLKMLFKNTMFVKS